MAAETVAAEMCSMNSVDLLYDCPHDLGRLGYIISRRNTLSLYHKFLC